MFLGPPFDRARADVATVSFIGARAADVAKDDLAVVSPGPCKEPF